MRFNITFFSSFIGDAFYMFRAKIYFHCTCFQVHCNLGHFMTKKFLSSRLQDYMIGKYFLKLLNFYNHTITLILSICKYTSKVLESELVEYMESN